MSLGGLANKTIYMFIGIVVVFLLATYLIPEAQTAGDNLSASGIPLASIFGSSGLVFVLISVALLLFVIGIAKIRSK